MDSPYFVEGQQAALEKLGMLRDAPFIRTKLRSEGTHKFTPKRGSPFEKLDEKDPRKAARTTKEAVALGGALKSLSGARPMNFPSGAKQMLQAPKMQMARGPQMRPPKLPGVVDPRTAKPAGMNLQHGIADQATTMDVGNSMSSPQRRFATPL